MNMSGMYFMIFCCVASAVGDIGVMRACNIMVTPMIIGSGLIGNPAM